MSSERGKRYWREWVIKQGQSGQNAMSFCKEHGLSVMSFYKWRAYFRNESNVQAPVLAGFAKIKIATHDSEKNIQSSGMIRVRITEFEIKSIGHLQELLRGAAGGC